MNATIDFDNIPTIPPIFTNGERCKNWVLSLLSEEQLRKIKNSQREDFLTAFISLTLIGFLGENTESFARDFTGELESVLSKLLSDDKFSEMKKIADDDKKYATYFTAYLTCFSAAQVLYDYKVTTEL